jgi:hypothetical protein
LPELRNQRYHLLQEVIEVWRYGGIGSEACKGARGAESAVKAIVFGHGAAERSDEGPDRKKALKQDRQRKAIRYLVDSHKVSVRRACDFVG